MIRFGMSVLKGLSKQHNIVEFVLYDWIGRENLLKDMLSRLPPVERDMFRTGEYTEYGGTFPCIRLSPSSEYYGYFLNGMQYCFGAHTLYCMLALSVTPG